MSRILLVLCVTVCVLFGVAASQLAQQNRLQPVLAQAQVFFDHLRERLQSLPTEGLFDEFDLGAWLDAVSPNNDTAPLTGDYDLVGKVIDVKDGDTLVLRSNSDGQHVEVRLNGIDTPEWNQAWGRQAGQALSSMVNRKQVGVMTEGIDTYGRTLGTLYYDNDNINLRMVAEGHAWWYRYYAKNDRQLAKAEAEARSQRLGLWQDADPIAPWDWRRNRRR